MGLLDSSRMRHLTVTDQKDKDRNKTRRKCLFYGHKKCNFIVDKHYAQGVIHVVFFQEAEHQKCVTVEEDRHFILSFKTSSRQPSSCLRQVGCGLVGRYSQSMMSTSDSVKGSQLKSQARRKRQSVLHNSSTVDSFQPNSSR